MTEEPFFLKDEWTIIDSINSRKYIFSWGDDAKDVCELLNNYHDTNEKLTSILMKLSDMMQSDVEEGIETYPKALVEYLINAINELIKNEGRT